MTIKSDNLQTTPPIALGQQPVQWNVESERGVESFTKDPSGHKPNEDWAWDSYGNKEHMDCKDNILDTSKVGFFKVFYGDVSAGGRFGTGTLHDNCKGAGSLPVSGVQGAVYGYSRVVPIGTPVVNYQKGSSVRYALIASGSVLGAYSNTSLNPHNSTFSNNSVDGKGNLTTYNRCLTNYWRETTGITVDTATTLDLKARDDNDRVYYEPTTNLLTITDTRGTADDLDLRTSIFVKGDIHIKGDIKNNIKQTGGSPTLYTAMNQIGSIHIVANGNIYIDPAVGRLDAVLVAIPESDGSAGKIYTCASPVDNPGSAYYPNSLTSGSHWETCVSETTDPDTTLHTNKQLVVNGSLIGQVVKLGRIHKTLNEEHHNSVSTLDPNSPPTNGTVASEVINLLPEYFVSTPALTFYNKFNYDTQSKIILPPNY